MTAAPPHRDAQAELVRRALWAVMIIFFLSGFGFASFASRMPAIRDGLDASPGAMGAVLLFSSAGSVLAMPFAGSISARLGSRRMIRLMAIAGMVGLSVVAVAVMAHSRPLACAALMVYGIGFGSWDVSMNLEGAAVERVYGRAIMPRFHAGFSLGSVAGAGIGAGAAALDIPFQVHIWCIAALIAAGALIATRYVLPAELSRIVRPQRTASRGPLGVRVSQALSAWREPRTLLIGVVVLSVALTEGAGNDWVSLSVREGFDTTDTMGAIGLGVFLAAMTAMRLFGTSLLDRFGRVTVLRICSALSFTGLIVFALVGPLPLALIGVGLWGLGAALGFPVGMSAASDDPLKAAKRVSVVSTIGYGAFLAGPPLLGMLAEHVGYRHALLAVAVPIAIGFALCGVMAKPAPEATRGAVQSA